MPTPCWPCLRAPLPSCLAGRPALAHLVVSVGITDESLSPCGSSIFHAVLPPFSTPSPYCLSCYFAIKPLAWHGCLAHTSKSPLAFDSSKRQKEKPIRMHETLSLSGQIERDKKDSVETQEFIYST